MESAEVIAEREQWLSERLAWLRDGGARSADGRLVVPLTGAAKAIKLATYTAKRVAKVYEDECKRKEEAEKELRKRDANLRRSSMGLRSSKLSMAG